VNDAERIRVTRAELEFTVQFVIDQNKRLCPGKWPKGPDGSLLAQAIVDHLGRCGWTVTRGPPTPLHSTKDVYGSNH
jgi:hypothetical protein